MTIAQIRSTIDFCNWSRNDLSGSTRAEFKACDVPNRLNRHIEAVKALVIPKRFASDIENKELAITRAEKTIAEWTSVQ